MKKSLLMVLALVLAFSVVLVSCTEPCEVCGNDPCTCEGSPFPADFPAALITELKAKGLNSFDGPEGASFKDYEVADGNVLIIWKNGSEAIFNAYKTKLGVAANIRATAGTDNFADVKAKFSNSFSAAFISLCSFEGTVEGFTKTAAVNDIFFEGTKK